MPHKCCSSALGNIGHQNSASGCAPPGHSLTRMPTNGVGCSRRYSRGYSRGYFAKSTTIVVEQSAGSDWPRSSEMTHPRDTEYSTMARVLAMPAATWPPAYLLVALVEPLRKVANGLAGFPRECRIKERLGSRVRLLAGESPAQNREIDGRSRRKKWRAADDLYGSPDGPPCVSSTRQPVSPRSGCTPAEPASAAPDSTQDETATILSQILNPNLSAAGRQTEKLFRDTDVVSSLNHSRTWTSLSGRNFEKTQDPRRVAPLHMQGSMALDLRAALTVMSSAPALNGQAIIWKGTPPLRLQDLSARTLPYRVASHLMHRGAFDRPQPVADKNGGQRSGQVLRTVDCGTFAGLLPRMAGVRSCPHSHAEKP